MSSDTAAKELIGFAKNRLQKFYNPTLYKAPLKRELTEEERMYSSMGGELAPTPAPGGIAGTGISALVQVSVHDADAPPPPPETFGAYAKKTEESGGVMAMMDLLVKELDKEMQEATVDEKNAQEEYEGMMADSAKKRADDSASITEKEAATADTKTMKEADAEPCAAQGGARERGRFSYEGEGGARRRGLLVSTRSCVFQEAKGNSSVGMCDCNGAIVLLHD